MQLKIVSRQGKKLQKHPNASKGRNKLFKNIICSYRCRQHTIFAQIVAKEQSISLALIHLILGCLNMKSHVSHNGDAKPEHQTKQMSLGKSSCCFTIELQVVIAKKLCRLTKEQIKLTKDIIKNIVGNENDKIKLNQKISN